MTVSAPRATAAPAYDIPGWRRRIPLLASHIPMNHCSHAPQTDATRAAAERYLESWRSRGMDWEGWMAEVGRAKEAFARLVNASPDEIAVFSSVSEATSAVASAVDFTRGRPRVVVTEAEFPTVAHVWLAQQSRGAAPVWVPVRDGMIDPADVEWAIDERTTLVSVSHGYYVNGFIQDLAAITARAHANGARVFVDAYQTMGAVPIDVRALGVDFLASGNLKYLMSVPGIAFLYVRRDLIEMLEPTLTGWFGRANPYAFDAKTLDWSATASRFETGTPPILNAYIARAGMEIVLELGVDHIREWHQVLARQLIDGGSARGFTLHGTSDVARKTANTAFVVPDAHRIEAGMRGRGVLASARGPVIRLAPHFYNTLDDVDAALDVLAKALHDR